MCRIDYDDSDGWWREEPHEVIARKGHRCDDCGRTIESRERYTRGCWLTPGEGFTTIAMCQQCVAAGRWLVKVCGGHFWPGVIDELREHLEDERETFGCPALEQLVAVGRSGWRQGDDLVQIEEINRWVDEALAAAPPEAMH